jgi:lysophospholipase L1-like esterase
MFFFPVKPGCRLLVVFWVGLGAMDAAAAPRTNNPALLFEMSIRAFEAVDKTNPPPQGGIEFIGSSTIAKWTNLARDFSAHKVFNRGFGGSRISDSVYYFDRVVLPYKPKMIVFFAGSNDLHGGKKPDTVADDFKAFVAEVEKSLPNTKVAFISINASPSRWKEVDQVKETNRKIADFITRDDKLVYIDTFHAMLDSDDKPRPELYRADQLHPNAGGYAIWIPIIAPYLNQGD